MIRCSAVRVAVIALILAIGSAAHAQTDASNVAAADALFVEARALLAKGEREAACKKFDESFRLDSTAMGTLFNLALCNERLGRYASAWRQFRDVAAASRTTRPDRAELAEARARAIEPRISKLRILVPEPARVAGLEVLLDGAVVPAASFGVPLPIDGGTHAIVTRAPQRKTQQVQVDIAAERGASDIVIPALAIDPSARPDAREATPRPLPAPEPPPKVESGSSGLRTAGFILGATGAAGLLAGAGFGASVLTQVDDVNDRSRSFSERRDKYDELDTHAQISTVAVIAGTALLAAGATLLIISKPSGGTAKTSRAPLHVKF